MTSNRKSIQICEELFNEIKNPQWQLKLAILNMLKRGFYFKCPDYVQGNSVTAPSFPQYVLENFEIYFLQEFDINLFTMFGGDSSFSYSFHKLLCDDDKLIIGMHKNSKHLMIKHEMSKSSKNTEDETDHLELKSNLHSWSSHGIIMRSSPPKNRKWAFIQLSQGEFSKYITEVTTTEDINPKMEKVKENILLHKKHFLNPRFKRQKDNLEILKKESPLEYKRLKDLFTSARFESLFFNLDYFKLSALNRALDGSSISENFFKRYPEASFYDFVERHSYQEIRRMERIQAKFLTLPVVYADQVPELNLLKEK